MRPDIRKSTDPDILQKLIRLREEENLSFSVIGRRLGFGGSTMSETYKKEKRRIEDAKQARSGRRV